MFGFGFVSGGYVLLCILEAERELVGIFCFSWVYNKDVDYVMSNHLISFGSIVVYSYCSIVKGDG